MPPSLRTRQAAAWFAGLSAIVLLVSLPAAERCGRRQGAHLATRHSAPRSSRHRAPLTARGDARQAVPTPFVEVDAEDHRDGRRDDAAYALPWHLQQRRIIEREYGYAVASLNLPDTESERLSELLTARREAAADARDAAQRLGIVGPEAKVAVKQSVDALTHEIIQLVGADAYYGRIEPAPAISTCSDLLQNNVGAGLAAEGNPLNSSQLYSLAEDYVSAVYSPEASAGPQGLDSSTGLTPQFEDFLARAAGKLTAAQLSAFHAFLTSQVQATRESETTPSAGTTQ